MSLQEEASTVKDKTKLHILHFLFFVTIAAAILITIYAMFRFVPDDQTLRSDQLIELSTGWQYDTAGGRCDTPALPAVIHADQAAQADGITLYYRLPDHLPKNPALEFITRQSTAEVFLDGQPIYSYGLDTDVPIGHLLGNARHVIVLPYESGGMEVSLRFVYPYGGAFRIPGVTLGSQSSIMYRFMLSNIGLVIFCMFSIFFCILILFVSIFFRIKHVAYHSSSLYFFASFIVISVIWNITDSNLLQLMTPNFPIVYFLSHLAFMLFPIPLLLFLRQNTKYRQTGYSIVLLLLILVFFTRILLFFGGVADLETTLPLTHLTLAVCAVACIILLAKEYSIYREKNALLFLIGFIALAVCLVISLFLFIFTTSLNYSVLFRIMLLFIIGAMFYVLFSEFTSMVKKGIENQMYRKLAYTDALTGMLNRMAFNEQIEQMQIVPDCLMMTMLVFDINRLKHINDTYGHGAGDKLIKCAAEVIQNCFGSIGTCYRLGGDEFAVILKDCAELSLQEKMDEFQTAADAVDTGNPEGLHIAVGYAVGAAEGKNFANRLFELADQAMYQHKEDGRVQE